MSSIMSAAGLAFYPIVALVLFLLAFAAIMVRTLHGRSRTTFTRCARIPLDDARLVSHADTTTPDGDHA